MGQKLNPNIIDKKNKSEFIKIRYNQCFTSPSTRCVETAKTVCKNKKIIKNNNLKEIDYGSAEGLNFKELNIKYPQIIKAWKKGLDPKFPKGESLSSVSIRLNKFINDQLISKKNTKNFNNLIFTHNVILRCLIGNIYKIKRKEWFRININYFDLLEFRLENYKLVSNIERRKYLSIFKNFNKNYNNV